MFTCEFPHATPADCSAHSYKRGRYSVIAPQMVHNHLDVVMGGGVSYLKESYQNDLKNTGYNVYLDDIQGFRNCSKAPVWALFGETSMPYWLEADKQQTPSLAEMTRKAIDLLSKNENGFFLMVEGSKVDWAAHDNDAKNALIEEIKAFVPSGEPEADRQAAHAFADRWNAIGFVPFKEKEAVNAAFKEAMQEKFPGYGVRSSRRETARSGGAARPKAPVTEKDRLTQKYNQLQQDIQTYENNIGFFGLSKGAELLKAQMQQRIDAAKAELKELEGKIRELVNHEEAAE